MFDDITRPEDRGGIRGFLARHFARVEYADLAKDEAQLISTIFSVLASIVGIAVLFRYGLVNGAGPIVLAVLAGLLRVSVSRAAALLLLVLTTLNLVLAPALLSFLWILLAARATQLTFAYHRLSKTQSVLSDIGGQPPAIPAASAKPLGSSSDAV